VALPFLYTGSFGCLSDRLRQQIACRRDQRFAFHYNTKPIIWSTDLSLKFLQEPRRHRDRLYDLPFSAPSDNVVIDPQFVGCESRNHSNCLPSQGNGNPKGKISPSKYCRLRFFLGLLLLVLMVIVIGSTWWRYGWVDFWRRVEKRTHRRRWHLYTSCRPLRV
jgi:hypothetical protein